MTSIHQGSGVGRVQRGQAVGRTLLVVASLSAAGAAVGAGLALPSTTRENSLLLVWQALGLAVFAGLFALIAWRPTAYPGVLELAILHKSGLTLAALAWPEAADAATVALVDGSLTALLLLSYVLLRAHRTWGRPASVVQAPPSGP